MSDRKAVIKNADMGEEMQQDAVDCATQALEKYNIEKVIFHLIKLLFSSYHSVLYFVHADLHIVIIFNSIPHIFRSPDFLGKSIDPTKTQLDYNEFIR